MAKRIWDSLWLNGHLACMTEMANMGIQANAAIAVKDQRIAWIGSMTALTTAPEQLAAEVVDLQGLWVTPGLIDCHTHLVYAGNRADEFNQRLHGATYTDIAMAGGGILATVRATRAATAEQLLAASRKRLQALLAEGVTQVEIKSGYGLDLATELKMLQVARQLQAELPVSVRTSFLGAHALPPEYHERSDAYLQFVINDVLPAAHAAGLVDAVDAFCEHIAFSRAQVAMLFAAAKQLNLPVKLHAEQLSDQQGAALAAEYQALSADHLEFVEATAVQKLAQAGTVAVLLPGAYYYLQEQRRPPIALFRQYQVPMAIATDCNPGSSPTTSLLLMLNMACTLFRLTPQEALWGVTAAAAQALAVADDYGTLEVGKMADFVIWDIQHPTDLVYQFGYNPCQSVIKHGAVSLQRMS